LRLSLQNALENSCIFFSILSAVILLVVWALPGTIAARNISIVVGLVASVVWIFLVRPKIKLYDLIVPALLMGVPIWLWIIYFFFPSDSISQYQEMTGTWKRVVLLIIFGFNLGLMISKNQKLAIWIWLAIASLPVASLMMYLHDVYIGGFWDIPNYTAFFKTKVAGVYFVMWPCLLGYAGMQKVLINWDSKFSPLKNYQIFFLSAFLVFICFYIFYTLRALNGFLVGFLFFLLLVIFFAKRIYYSCDLNRRLKILFLWLIFFVTAAIAFIYLRYDHANEQKLTYIVSDVLSASRINQSSSWVLEEGSEYVTPKTETGRSINLSTFTRVSWFLKGLEYLTLHPFGSGDVSFGFGSYVRSEYPRSQTTKTHSAWLDFALGSGLPGLLMFWCAIYLTLREAIKARALDPHKFMPMAIFWMLVGIWVLWWPGELSYREFIEHYFFMVIIFSSCVKSCSTSQNADNSTSP
jgi:O-antigen ligase